MSQAVVLLYLIAPLVAAFAARRPGTPWLDPLVSCYAIGILLASSGLPFDREVTKMVTEASVPLAIPQNHANATKLPIVLATLANTNTSRMRASRFCHQPRQ